MVSGVRMRKKKVEAAPGIEPGIQGFADLCLTIWLYRHALKILAGLFANVNCTIFQKFFKATWGDRLHDFCYHPASLGKAGSCC